MSISHKLRHVIAALALFVGTPPITAGADVIGITSIAELGPNADSGKVPPPLPLRVFCSASTKTMGGKGILRPGHLFSGM
jgi:hypothetical protein